MTLTFGSVCSGIEAASQAWEQLGWQAVWLSEIEPFPCALLAHRYPNIPNLGDMTKIPSMLRAGQIAAPDILVGGSPCQSFSVAGLRKGLSDARGALTLCFIEIANEIDAIRARAGLEPAIIVWENVPGVFSDSANAFGCFVGGLAGSDCELKPTGRRGKWTNAGVVLGPQRTVAWRVLDAQYWGLAQRRKRVFVVASARAQWDPTKVLFERNGLRRNPTPVRSASQSVAATLEASIARSRGAGTSQAILVPETYRKLSHGEYCADQIGSTLLSRDYKDAGDLVCVVHGTQDPVLSSNLAFTLGRNNGQENVVVYGLAGNVIGRAPKNGGNGQGYCEDVSYTLTKTDQHGVAYAVAAFTQNSRDEVRFCGGDGAIVGALAANAGAKQQSYVMAASWTLQLTVRRLMPIECERLQGFPDNYTQIPYRNKSADDCPDSPRYKALGNSMAVPVMAWLGLQIKNHLNELRAHDLSLLSALHQEAV